MTRFRVLVLGLSLIALSFAARTARAADCSTIKPGNPHVYVVGTAKPYVSSLARVLFADPTQPLTIFYKGVSSCIAWDAILNGTPITGTVSYWDPSSMTVDNEVTCTIPGTDAGTGVVADVGVADVFASTCISLPNGLPQDVGDFFGPVQTMTFVVPKGSNEKSISATAAYFVYGLGDQSGVSPWTNAANILRLDDQSGTQRIIAAGIGVDPTKWKGTNLVFSGALISAITSVTPANAPSTIGILAATNIVGNVPTSLNVLAYKHYNQTCGYYPDSTESAKDKANVRDGHYALWGPVHIMSKIANGYPVNADAKRIVSYWTGTATPPNSVDLIQVDAVNNLVPTCAMRVKRSTEMGPLTSSAPQNACGCYFESKTGGTSCKTCSTATDCAAPTPVCSFGYCEAQ